MAAPAPAAAGNTASTFAAGTTTLTPHPAHEYTWRLEGLTPALFADKAAEHFVESKVFRACGCDWRFALRCGPPPTRSTPAGIGRVLLRLDMLTPAATVTVDVQLVMGWGSAKQDACTFCTQGTTVSERWFSLTPYERLRAVGGFDKLAPSGVLTVKVTLCESGFQRPLANPIVVPPPCWAACWGALLDSGRGADVTLLCGGERLAAHALVLRTRSPVLAAQLDGPLAAPADAVPVPPDITPHTLRRLLRFIYTDELEPASPEEATHLLNGADHYGLPRLFAICERTLCSALAVESVATTLTLADQHGASALKHAALRFVAANALAVMATPGWQHLAAARPALMGEALHTLAAGAPPEPEGAGGAGEDAGEDAPRRVRRRTR
jgi:hypothetical protein